MGGAVPAVIPDAVAINNERVKLLAGLMNAVCIALVGVGVIAPAVSVLGAGATLPGPRLDLALSAGCMGLGVAFHLFAHYILGRLRKAGP